MTTEEKNEVLVALEKDIIAKAKHYCWKYPLPGWEWEDYAQELRLWLLEKLDKYEGRNDCKIRTFAVKIMDNRLKNITRDELRRALNHCVFIEYFNL